MSDIVLISKHGEELTLDSPTQDLAEYLDGVKELRSRLDEERAIISRELVSRMDQGAKWTLHAGPYKLTAPSPAVGEEWDGAELYDALCELVEDGAISMDAVNAAVEIHLSYKVKKAGVNALRKIGGPVAGAIDGLAREAEPKPRNVSVTRA